MSSAFSSYLRTHRRKAGLTQSDVAFLLGLSSGQTIGKYEALVRLPSLRTALACCTVFDLPLDELLPGEASKVDRLVIERARALLDRLDAQDAPIRGEVRLAALQAIIERASSR